MGEPMVKIAIEIVVMVGLLIGIAVWRIGQVVSWRALLRTALATGSFETCVAYIQFCMQRRQS